jgi:2,5-diketo-D-gluconate reductase A
MHHSARARAVMTALLFTHAFLVTGASTVGPYVKLNNGLLMPSILYGSGGAGTQDNVTGTAIAVAQAVSSAIGFKGVDMANHVSVAIAKFIARAKLALSCFRLLHFLTESSICCSRRRDLQYHNQIGVRDGIKASGTPRSKLWLQTKVEPCGHSIVRHSHCYEDSLVAFNSNLQQLDVDYVDLTLLHAPPCVPNTTWADAKCRWDSAIYPSNCNCRAAEPCAMMQAQWKALEEMVLAGKTRAIGVSNFCPACLECLAKVSNTTPAVNQLQFHAGVGSPDPRGLLSYNTARGIMVQAYSPLGGEQAGAVLTSPVTEAAGAAHGNRSSAQAVLRWVLQLGYALTAATTNAAHMASDLDIFSFGLTDKEMKDIGALTVAPDDPTKDMCLYN